MLFENLFECKLYSCCVYNRGEFACTCCYSWNEKNVSFCLEYFQFLNGRFVPEVTATAKRTSEANREKYYENSTAATVTVRFFSLDLPLIRFAAVSGVSATFRYLPIYKARCYNYVLINKLIYTASENNAARLFKIYQSPCCWR